MPTNDTATESPFAIEVHGLSKSFNRTRALRGVDIELPWGETLALFGHNGAGKSTLIRTLATLTRPDEGSVRVGGFEHGKQSALIRSVVGYVGHASLLYEDMTPRENLRFFAKLYGLADAEERIEASIAEVGAEPWVDRRVRGLSNGMQKRVAIARALLHRPRILLLDEPETGLDERGLELLETIVRGVSASGASVVLSTHGIERGLALADRVVVLADGRVTIACLRSEIGAAGIHGTVTGQTEARS
jgi:heme ABC exporter ATP-binding subunit CcmA